MTNINPKCSVCKCYFVPLVKSSGLFINLVINAGTEIKKIKLKINASIINLNQDV